MRWLLLVLCSVTSSAVIVDVDMPKFLGHHNPMWNDTFDDWEDGPFIGNGLVGAILRTNGTRLELDIGRTDIWDKRHPGTRGWTEPGITVFMQPRLPVGKFFIELEKPIKLINVTLDIYTATVYGTVLGSSEFGFTLFAPFSKESGIVLKFISNTIGMKNVHFEPALAAPTRSPLPKNYLYNPDALCKLVVRNNTNITVCTQELLSGGNYATGYGFIEESLQDGKLSTILAIAVENNTPGNSTDTAVDSVVELLSKLTLFINEHHRHWDEYFSRSFVSIAQSDSESHSTILESFYWMQIYKLGSASRPNGTAIDLMGPWFQPSGWELYWFDLNVELTYWITYTSGYLELGNTLSNYIQNGLSQLIKNSDSQGMSMSTGCTSDLNCSTSPFIGQIVGNLPWVCHNLYLGYNKLPYPKNIREIRLKLIPVLNQAMEYYSTYIIMDEEGGHLPFTISPEYPSQNVSGFDTNYDYALLTWGIRTLLQYGQGIVNTTYWGLVQSKLLSSGPTDDVGFMVNNATSFAVPHRHFSHAFAIYPLRLCHNISLMEKTLQNFEKLSCPSGNCLNGYTYVGAAMMNGLIGKGDVTLKRLMDLLFSEIRQSTMYSEGNSPCIESPLAAASVVLDMLLYCNATHTEIFPILPQEWVNVSVANLLCYGGVKISASRTNGVVDWVFVNSSSSTSHRSFIISVDLVEPVSCSIPYTRVSDGQYWVSVPPGETFFMRSAGVPPKYIIRPTPSNANQYHYWGTKSRNGSKRCG